MAAECRSCGSCLIIEGGSRHGQCLECGLLDCARDSGRDVKLLTVACLVLGLIVVVSALLFLMTGCAAARSELPAPCDDSTLAAIALDCRALVRAKCERSDAGVVSELCPELIACRRRVAEWRACSDAGVPVSSGVDGGP